MLLADTWSIKGAWSCTDSQGQSRCLTTTTLKRNVDQMGARDQTWRAIIDSGLHHGITLQRLLGEKGIVLQQKESRRKCGEVFLETAGENRVSSLDCSLISCTRLRRCSVCTLNSVRIGMKPRQSSQTLFMLLCLILKGICVAKVEI